MSDGAGDGARIEAAALRRPHKSDAAFRTISEVSEDLDVPQHVLRFWESRFQTIRPLKRGGGRRYYRPEDVQLLRRIRDLLYKDGYTIRGVQKLLREQARGPSLPGLEEGEPGTLLAPPRLGSGASPSPAPPAASALASAAVPILPAATPSVPAPERSAAPGAATPPAVGITGARRALIETLIAEIDELRTQLSEAVKTKPGN